MANAALAAHLRRNASQPVTDAVRDDMSARLNAAFAEGQLDVTTFEALLASTFDARSCGDLVAVAGQLPDVPVSNLPDIVVQHGQPGQLAPIRSGAVVARRLVRFGVPLVLALAMVLLVAHLVHLF